MKKCKSYIPNTNYGVLIQDKFNSQFEEISNQVIRLGFAILDSGYTRKQIKYISAAFDRSLHNYVKKYGENKLRGANELNTIRALLTHGNPVFIELANNSNLLKLVSRLISGKYILNQQNGIINPPSKLYNQGLWHRDLPFQHYTSSTPLAINALFCVDEFTEKNGSTFVLPATHKQANFPSDLYIKKNALQVTAKAGQYIILDCMLFHSGGFNQTSKVRRAVNHVYTIPLIKQQINLPAQLGNVELSADQKELFGFNFQEASSIEEYIKTRRR